MDSHRVLFKYFTRNRAQQCWLLIGPNSMTMGEIRKSRDNSFKHRLGEGAGRLAINDDQRGHISG